MSRWSKLKSLDIFNSSRCEWRWNNDFDIFFTFTLFFWSFKLSIFDSTFDVAISDVVVEALNEFDSW